MLDPFMRRIIDPPLERVSAVLAGWPISANAVTIAGFALGLAAMLAIALEAYGLGLLLLVSNRLADGLDGAVARRRGVTDLGGFLDITLDFIFYSGLVFAFAVAAPETNGLAAAFLIFSFVGTGCSFLAFAVMAAKRSISTEQRGRKSLYYLGGITEGTETILLFVLSCIFPDAFPVLAWIFGGLCWITTGARIATAYEILGEND